MSFMTGLSARVLRYMPMPEKPEKASVLGKLSAAKTQDKAVPHAGAPAKKKEEMNR